MLEHKWGPAKNSLQSESNFLCSLSKVSSLDRFIGELQEDPNDQWGNGDDCNYIQRHLSNLPAY